MGPAVVSGIVTAPVSYWPLFSCPFQQFSKSSRKLTWPSFLPVSKVTSNRSLLINFMTQLNIDLSSYEIRRMPSHVLHNSQVICDVTAGAWGKKF